MPEDIALVGFDDAPVDHPPWPQLTVVAQPAPEIGAPGRELLASATPDATPGHVVLHRPSSSARAPLVIDFSA